MAKDDQVCFQKGLISVPITHTHTCTSKLFQKIKHIRDIDKAKWACIQQLTSTFIISLICSYIPRTKFACWLQVT